MAVGNVTSEPCSNIFDQLFYLEKKMRSLILFFLGIPIPIIILIALFVH